MALEKDIKDAQKLLRNGSAPLELPAGNNGSLVRHPQKPHLFVYQIGDKMLEQDHKTITFTENDVREYADSQRLREKFAEDLNSGKYEKENKKPEARDVRPKEDIKQKSAPDVESYSSDINKANRAYKSLKAALAARSTKQPWVKGEIPGAVNKESRSDMILANLYLQAGVPEWGLESNKGMFMKNPNNNEEYLYVVKGAPMRDKDNNNQIMSFNKGQIALLALEQRAKENGERVYKALRKADQPVINADKDTEQASSQSHDWIPLKKN